MKSKLNTPSKGTASTRTLTGTDIRPSSSASSGGTTGTSSMSVPGMGTVPSMASAVAVVTIPSAANAAHHSLLSPALSSSASGQSDEGARAPLNGGEDGNVWYEFGCV